MSKNKRKVILAALTAAITISFQAHAKEVQIDSTAAIVNSDIILTSELDTTQKAILKKFNASGQKIDNMSARHAALEQLISKVLVMQLAKRQGVNINDMQLDAAINNAAVRTQQSVKSLLNQIAPGAPESVAREIFKEEMIYNDVKRNYVRNRITIADSDVQLLAKSLRNTGNIEPRYHLAQIIVPLSATATAGQLQSAVNTVNSIKSQLSQGASFNNLAARYTPGSLAAQGGDLGYLAESQVPPPFLPAILKAKTGDILGPFRSTFGMHILKLLDVSNEVVEPVKLYDASHILLKTSIIFSDDAAQKQLDHLRRSIMNGSISFETAAQKYSEDSPSAINGGSLGYAQPDIYDPRFAQMLVTLKPGEISQPVQSAFGWHIILLKDVKIDKDSDQAYQQKARSLIFQKHFQEESVNFERELREMAYIQVLDPELLSSNLAVNQDPNAKK